MEGMKTLIRWCLIFFIATPALGSGWKLVWSDEFKKPGPPDPAQWRYETGWIRNHEAQYYTFDRRENARVADGMLIIEARKERYLNPRFDPAASELSNWNRSREFADYTSASLTSKASWTYGRVEVRAKLPAGRGVWPAIWMLGDNIRKVGWPACGEIDIMEFWGIKPGMVYGHIHAEKYDVLQKAEKGAGMKLPTASDAFHTYAIEWDAEHIDFSVDNHKYYTYRNEHTGKDAWPFDRPEFLILNLAIGGDPSAQTGIDDSIFPQQFSIKWVRVYQKQP
jgi:beta-glucanase (GH16 family)